MKKEFELISKIKSLVEKKLGRYKTFAGGIGDDCAILKDIGKNEQMLVSVDALAEGVHFDLSYCSMEDVGYKSAVSNISDIISKGGTPLYLFISLSIPKNISNKNIISFYKGLIEACALYNVKILGGDTTSSKSGFFISITILGKIKKRGAYLRSDAKPGDHIYVLGKLGESSIGLQMLLNGERNKKNKCIQRHLRPLIFPNEFRRLYEKYKIHAAMDISDGLVSDLSHIAKASSVDCRINEYADFSKVNSLYKKLPKEKTLPYILSGGEDYAVLFTSPCVIEEEYTWNENILRVGEVIKKSQKPRVLVYRDEKTLSTKKYKGYEHSL